MLTLLKLTKSLKLPWDEVLGKVDDLIAGLVGLESTREHAHKKCYQH